MLDKTPSILKIDYEKSSTSRPLIAQEKGFIIENDEFINIPVNSKLAVL